MWYTTGYTQDLHKVYTRGEARCIFQIVVATTHIAIIVGIGVVIVIDIIVVYAEKYSFTGGDGDNHTGVRVEQDILTPVII